MPSHLSSLDFHEFPFSPMAPTKNRSPPSVRTSSDQPIQFSLSNRSLSLNDLFLSNSQDRHPLDASDYSSHHPTSLADSRSEAESVDVEADSITPSLSPASSSSSLSSPESVSRPMSSLPSPSHSCTSEPVIHEDLYLPHSLSSPSLQSYYASICSHSRSQLSNRSAARSLLPDLLSSSGPRRPSPRTRARSISLQVVTETEDPLLSSLREIQYPSRAPVRSSPTNTRILTTADKSTPTAVSRVSLFSSLVSVISRRAGLIRSRFSPNPSPSASPINSPPPSPTFRSLTRDTDPVVSVTAQVDFLPSSLTPENRAAFAQFVTPVALPNQKPSPTVGGECHDLSCLTCYHGETIQLRTFSRTRTTPRPSPPSRIPFPSPKAPCIPGSIQEHIHQTELQDCWNQIDASSDDHILALANYLPSRLANRIRQSLSLPWDMRKDMVKQLSSLYVHRYTPAPREPTDDIRKTAISRAHALTGRTQIVPRSLMSPPSLESTASGSEAPRELVFIVMSGPSTASSISSALTLGLGCRSIGTPSRAGVVTTMTSGKNPVTGRVQLCGTPVFGHSADFQWTRRGVPAPGSRWDSSIEETRPIQQRTFTSEPMPPLHRTITHKSDAKSNVGTGTGMVVRPGVMIVKPNQRAGSPGMRVVSVGRGQKFYLPRVQSKSIHDHDDPDSESDSDYETEPEDPQPPTLVARSPKSGMKISSTRQLSPAASEVYARQRARRSRIPLAKSSSMAIRIQDAGLAQDSEWEGL